MAKAKASAARTSLSPEEIALRLFRIARSIDTVECTAVCVEQVLLMTGPGTQREIAVCVERNVANQLGRISRNVEMLAAVFGARDYVPLAESPILGLRFRAASDEPPSNID